MGAHHAIEQVGRLGVGHDMADERFDLQLSTADEVEDHVLVADACPGPVGVGVAHAGLVGAGHDDFAAEELVGFDGDGAAGGADEDDAAAIGCGFDHGGIVADVGGAVELDLGAAAGQHAGQCAAPAPGQLCVGADFFDHVVAAGVDEVGSTELAGEVQARLNEVDADERLGADEAAELERHQPDDAESVDGNRFSYLDLGATHAVEGHITENAEGDFDIGQVFGQFLDVVLLGNDDFAGFEVGCYEPVGGMVAAAKDAVADGDFLYLAAGGLDDADGGVAESCGLESGLLGGAGVAAGADAVHFGAGADLGETGAYQELIGRGDRHLELFDFNLARRGEDQAFSLCHVGFPLDGGAMSIDRSTRSSVQSIAI